MTSFIPASRLLAAIALLLLLALGARADERILLFDTDLTVNANGNFTVSETIRVNAEGRDIRRGIFRDFPLVFTDGGGRELKVDFRVVGVTRNGQPEPWRTEWASRAVRIYFGSADVFLPRGVHTYVFTYETDRQLRQFEDHDEVLWNVTGNAWQFPIDRATATIRLPGGAPVDGMVWFTGRLGARETNATGRVGPDRSTASFTVTRPLRTYEGLTVGVKFPKGFITEPDAATAAWWWLKDHAGEVISVSGLGAVFAFLLVSWVRVGRDPPAQIVVPRWEMPDGVSPALTHYIHHKGLQGQGFRAISAAALSLAVKGYLTLDNNNGVMTMRRTALPVPLRALPVGERTLMQRIAVRDGTLTIDKSNGKTVEAMASDFRSAMEGEHRSVFYKANIGPVVFGVVASVLVALATLIFGGLGEETIMTLIPVLIAAAIVTLILVQTARSAGRSLVGKLQLVFVMFIVGALLSNVGLQAIAATTDLIQRPVVIGALATLLMVNVLFFFLMGAPTQLGQKRSAETAGLKRYLTVSEADRMNMLGSPDMSPKHYETLLPYAVALDVEKPWSRAFQSWLAAAVAAGAATAAAYHGPGWYRGDEPFSPGRVGDTLGSLAGDLSSSMTSSLPAPVRSSSGFSGGVGGGGFSGGGGGGGGGGGW